MPKVGDIRRKPALADGRKNGYMKYIWLACEDCGEERWLQLPKKGIRRWCYKCSIKHRKSQRAEANPFWKGGKRMEGEGYVSVLLQPNDFFFPMVNYAHYVREHRLVMAKHLGRNLHRWEIVHHKNGIKTDNRIENLQLVTDDRHKQITILENRIKQLEQRVTFLEAENVLLKSESEAATRKWELLGKDMPDSWIAEYLKKEE